MTLPSAFKIVHKPKASVTRVRCNAISFLTDAYTVFFHPMSESFVLLFIIYKKKLFITNK